MHVWNCISKLSRRVLNGDQCSASVQLMVVRVYNANRESYIFQYIFVYNTQVQTLKSLWGWHMLQFSHLQCMWKEYWRVTCTFRTLFNPFCLHAFMKAMCCYSRIIPTHMMSMLLNIVWKLFDNFSDQHNHQGICSILLLTPLNMHDTWWDDAWDV